MSIEKLQILSNILQEYKNIIVFDANRFIATKNYASFEKVCAEKEITTEKENEILFLKLKSFISPNLIFWDQITTHFESNFVNCEFSIINTNGDYCYHSVQGEDLLFNDNASELFKISCQNIFSYYILYNYLKSTDFADHHNSANKEIVIYNSAKGIYKINYDTIPVIDNKMNIATTVQNLIRTSSQIELNPFFKNSLDTFANGKGSIFITEIISKATEILNATKRDYTLVSKQFDFDKFRDSLYKEKEKYFSNIREIINKIFSQAIGIPISISAALLATYKVSDDTFMLILVLLSFIVYVAYYVKIQLVYKEDIQEINNDFKNDFDIIMSKSGLPADIIKKEKEKIERKIVSSISMVNYLINIIIGLGVLVCCFILYEIIKSETICLLKSLLKILFL